MGSFKNEIFPYTAVEMAHHTTGKLSTPELANFLKLYFDFAYFLCLSPFRFKRDENTGGFMVHSWRPQKVVCVMTHLFSLLMLINDFRDKILQPQKIYFKNPVKYFQMVDSMLNLVYKLTLMKRLWRNQTEFLHVMEFIAYRKSLRETKTKIQKPIFIISIFGLYIGVAVASLIAGKGFLPTIYDWSPTLWYRRIIALGRHILFLDGKTSLSSKYAPELSSISGFDTFIAFFMGLGLLSRFMLGFFIDMCILAMSATLWSATYSFSKMIVFDPLQKWGNGSNVDLKKDFLHSEHGEFWPSVLYNFDAVRRLALLINKAMGNLTLWFVLEALMYYSVNLDALLITTDVFKRSYLVAYYAGSLGIFILSADICKNMEKLKSWIIEDEHRSSVEYHNLNLILHEMLAKDIGIRASGIFTVTYPLFASFIGTIVTFFIICVQQIPA